MLLLLLVVVLAVSVFLVVRRKPFTTTSHWQNFLDGVQISSADFYAAIKAGLAARQITKVHIAEKSFLEAHILSAKRVYLRVSQNEFMYYICAAPYGTGTFVSSWMCVKDESVVNRIPVLNKLAGKDRHSKTFYQMDTEAMFRLAVHTTVVDTVNSLTEAKGSRGLPELETTLKN